MQLPQSNIVIQARSGELGICYAKEQKKIKIKFLRSKNMSSALFSVCNRLIKFSERESTQMIERDFWFFFVVAPLNVCRLW